jgi:predicted acylesterase/phospholipase RssA
MGLKAEIDSKQMFHALARLALALAVFVPIGCAAPHADISPMAAGFKPVELVDPTSYGGEGAPPVSRQMFALAERVRESQRPSVLPPKRSVLVLSGGGSFGAYTAGALCGWTEAGNRPQFDVVTGVSTGAIIAVFAFLGPDFDAELRRAYTTVKSSDVFRKKFLVSALYSNSLNDSEPLYQQIGATITPEVVERIAAEHKNGRRLYIGTTDLDGRRPVVWDLGAIAASGKAGSRALLCKLVLASAAIPGFFPAVDIPVEIDGKPYVERHVDGGLTQPLFFRPPFIPADKRSVPLPELFFGSDVYVIVAGKLYADAQPVKPQVVKIVRNSVTTFIYAQTRDALVKIYMQSMLCGMNYHLAAIPSDFAAPTSATDFQPAEMTRMFEEGRRQVTAGTAWRKMPPGVGGSGKEEQLQRSGTTLTVDPLSGQTAPAPDDRTGPPLGEQGLPAIRMPIAK